MRVGLGAPPPPDDEPFALPWADAFDNYVNDTLPLFSSDMFGAFTIWHGASAAPAHTLLPRTACAGAGAARAWPGRCGAATSGVLRQMTREPPIGWGGEASNMATLYGNASLRNVRLSVAALIETPEAGYAPAATPYVLIGLHGGKGTAGGSAPRDFYRQGPDFDFVWANVLGEWGCQLAGAAAACGAQHSLPGGFGYDTWHSLSLAAIPRAGGGADIVFEFDGAQLLNYTQAPGDAKNGGAGGFVGIVTGAHRTQFDNLFIESTATAARA